jgi:hypothetical protein
MIITKLVHNFHIQGSQEQRYKINRFTVWGRRLNRNYTVQTRKNPTQSTIRLSRMCDFDEYDPTSVTVKTV